MRNQPIPSWIAAAIAALIAGGAYAQSTERQAGGEPAARFGEKIDVVEVLLDVLATDRKGNVVPGLGVDDFIVIEDGKRIEPASVSFYTTRYGISEPGDGVQEIPASRFLIFFFQDQTRTSNSIGRLVRQQFQAGRDSHEWVRDEMLPSDWVAVVGYDHKLIVYQDFTQDRDSILFAIQQATQGKDPGIRRPSERRRQARDPFSLLRRLPDDIELRKRTTNMYDALRIVAEATGDVVGRKNLLLFTIGFGELESISYDARPDQRYYPALEQALNAHNVAVYPIDLMPAGINHRQHGFLNQLARDSGGYYYQNLVNFETALKRISQENGGYYLLSYRTEVPAGERGYREVKVKTRAKKVHVRARRGFRYGDLAPATTGEGP